MKRMALKRRYGHASHTYVWEVSLQVISPSRPNLRHQLQYTVQAQDRPGAIRTAEQHARLDGQSIVSVVGAARKHKIGGR
jgi:hypothetical protein